MIDQTLLRFLSGFYLFGVSHVSLFGNVLCHCYHSVPLYDGLNAIL